MTSRDSHSNKVVEIATLKAKVKELESQVTDYRRRLGELRKAKSTTVVKRERELLEVNAPSLGKREGPDPRVAELERQLRDEKTRSAEAIKNIKRQHAADVETQQQNKKENSMCGHEEEIKALHQKIDDLGNDKAILLSENCDLNEKVQQLITELSIKEAHWCEQEEQMKIKMQSKWGDQYKEWMEQTEKKIEELQKTNQLLREYIKKEKPGGARGSTDD